MEAVAEEVIATCIRFSRMLSEAREPGTILGLLAKVAVEHLGVDASVVLQLTEGGDMRVAASQGLPPEGCEHRFVAESVGQELEEELLGACGQRFQRAMSVPLVSSRNLYGALVLLFLDGHGLKGHRPRLARGLADLGAVALDQAYNRVRLERSLEELRATRELLARTERLRALGELSTGIAHDLRNIFNPLALQLELLRRRSKDPEMVLQVADALARVVKRGVETVERLRLFGHQSMKAELEVADLDVLVEESLALSRPRLEGRPGIHVQVEHGGPVWVRVLSAEVVTSLVNLFINASEAMPQGGTLTVRTGTEDSRGWLRVTDTGTGMPPEVRERIFEPFFTTKGKEGTGLGLAMVDTFVKRSGGHIEVESELGKGTSFTLRFPLADGTRVSTPVAH